MIRTSRIRALVAATAILLSPGVLAPWLQLSHACPAESASKAMPMAGPMGTHHSDGGHSGHAPGHLIRCSCLGACHLPALFAPTNSLTITAGVTQLAGTGLLPVTSERPTHLPHTLPFAQAPPAFS